MKRLVSVSFLLVFMVLTAMAQDFPVTRHAYIAKFLKSKITALIWYEETEDGDLSGEIIYTSSKHQTPIRIFGTAYDMDQDLGCAMTTQMTEKLPMCSVGPPCSRRSTWRVLGGGIQLANATGPGKALHRDSLRRC